MFKVTLRRKEDELGPEETSHGERVLLLFSRSVVSAEVRREGRGPLPDHAGESPLLSRSGGEKGLRGSGAGTLGHQLPEFTQTHVHRVSDAIQQSG